MNRVFLIGNLTRDVETRTTATGKTVANFGLAVQRRRAADGTQSADFFNVSAWDKLGENCAKYLAKGRKVAVGGSIQIRAYDAQDGTKRTAVDIIANEIEFLPGGQHAQGADAAAAGNAPHIPETREEMAASGFAAADDDELPF
nr:MAG TPA: Single strand binding protein [Caudoviricetes sp.]